MLHRKRPVISISLVVLLTALTACANSPSAKKIEESLAADPKLKDNPVTFGTKEVSDNQPPQTTPPAVQLPADFPKEIPLYPNATLEKVTPSSDENPNLSTQWLSADPTNVIASYYRQQFQAKNWQILPQSVEGRFEAKQNDLQLKVSVQPKTVTNTSPNQPQTASTLLIEYQRNSTETAQANPTSSPNSTSETPSPSEESPFVNSVQTPELGTQQSNTSAPQAFSDISKAPQEVQKYIQDLATLGVLRVEPNAVKSNSDTTTNLFEPNKNITRREYARWLVAANNAMHANNPAKQIRLASDSSQPAFQDVPKTDPNFPEIQGLAEAGLIPSPLSGDSTAVLFRPNAPLLREQLILWKVPLDTRQSLPNANLETVKQTWGFQDAAKIDPKALRSVLADYQNSDRSNIRRVLGYTTLFQPKKAVTRAEAAAALWYFGTQGEGISAEEALKAKPPQQ